MDIKCNQCNGYMATVPEHVAGEFAPFEMEVPCRRCSKVKAVVRFQPFTVPGVTYKQWVKKSSPVAR